MNYKDFKGEDFAKDAFFIKWVKGNPESQWFWKTFSDKYPGKSNEIEEGRRLVELMLSVNREDVLENQVLSSMRDDLIMSLKARKEREKEEVFDHRNLYRSDRRISRTWLAVAASVALILSTGALYWKLSERPTGHTIERLGINQVETTSNDSAIVRINPRGQKSVMLLPDGTKVWLNAESKLSYLKNFKDRDQRDVYLEGEAFFDVTKNPDKPFIVHTSEINIRVLGTSFNVKSYADDSRIETTLVEGKVEIDKGSNSSSRKQKTVLMPNQKASFSKESKNISIETIAPLEAVSWRQDRLVFKSESFGEVIKQLERWYNVRINVEESDYLACTLTANIEKESLEEILDFLAVTHKITYTVSGQDIFIKDFECK